MTTRHLGLRSSTIAILFGLAATMPTVPAHAIIVYDPANYAQNVLQAARELQSVTNQIQSLQNEAVMIEGMTRNLDHLDFSSLARMTASLQQIGQLMGQAQGIGYQIEQTDQRFRAMFPGSQAPSTTDAAVRDATNRLQAVLSAFHDTMATQSRIVTEAGNDASNLADLVTQSQGARGNLQVSQATNQLLALVAKQQIELQAMLASQGRAEAMDRAAQAQAQSDAQAATRRFLGSGSAYTPQ